MMQEKVVARAVVKGRVQGVFYRQSTLDKARALGLTGWVRNQPDGSVLLEACGNKSDVESLLLWCNSGPPSARVDEVTVTWIDPSNVESHSFVILG